MKFRKIEEKDLGQAKELISVCYNLRAPLHILKEEETIVCTHADELVGLACFWRNELHNRTVVEEICVSPNFRRQKIGSLLHNELIKLFPLKKTDYALDAFCFNDNTEAKKFLNSLNYKKYLESYSNIINIDSLNLIEGSNKIITLEELYKSSHMIEEVKSFHMRRYDEDHEPFLPVTKSHEIRNDYYHGGNPQFGVAIFNKTEMIGCSLAFLNFEERLEASPKDTTCLHGYAIGASLEDEASNIQAMYSYQAKLLKQAGHKNIYIEFDSIERTASQMLKWIPKKQRVLERHQYRL
jgi:ribosomal protein S18 acetylase RimI-like enzyme